VQAHAAVHNRPENEFDFMIFLMVEKIKIQL
jgi:hypothetical protein